MITNRIPQPKSRLQALLIVNAELEPFVRLFLFLDCSPNIFVCHLAWLFCYLVKISANPNAEAGTTVRGEWEAVSKLVQFESEGIYSMLVVLTAVIGVTSRCALDQHLH